MAEVNKPLTVAELADVDARYVPFPSFHDWPQRVPRQDLWARDHHDLREAAALAEPDDLRKAQEIALRTAAFDTGAIEGLYPTDRGLTFTVATQAAAWEQEVLNRNAAALGLFRAQLEAFELILDMATAQFPMITQSLIRRIHEVVTGPQETYTVVTPVGPQEQALPKGAYKQQPNHVRTADGEIHAYAPVDMTQPETQRLLDELDADAFREAHPVLQASYVHYALVAIHPFADGNGRVARAIASAYTYRAASVPLLVLAHHRDLYFAALASADRGEADLFVEFIARVGRDALEMVTESLKSAQAPQPEDVLARFKEIYAAQGDLSHQQLDDLANDFVGRLVEVLGQQIERLSLPEGVEIQPTAGTGGQQQPPAGFRSVAKAGPRYVGLRFEAAAPGEASRSADLEVYVSTESDTATSIMVRASVDSEEITFGLADIYPQLSSAARLRLESYLRRILGIELDALLRQSKERLAG